MIRGKYLRERKAIRIKRRLKLLIILTILMLLYRIVFSSFSLYESNAESKADMDIAFFLLDTSYETRSISLEDMAPGDTRKVTFSVANFYFKDIEGGAKEEVVSDVDMDYEIKIRTTTNLPLKFTLTKSQEAIEENDIALNVNSQDDFGTYFTTLLNDSGQFISNNPDGTKNALSLTYALNIEFPKEYDTIEYQNIIECIEISVEATQIVD